jgi:hypothetical protein
MRSKVETNSRNPEGRKAMRILLTALQLIVVSLCLSLPALAQSPSPTPVGTPSSGRTLSENIAGLVQRAGEMIPKLRAELESPLLSWFETISIVLAALITMFSFARLWRENNGAGGDVFWWFGRLAVCLALLGSGPFLINYLNSIGKQIAQGNELIGDSALSRFYHAQRDSFNDSYQKFTEGLFTVRVNGQDVPIKPGPNGTDIVLGVLYDKEANIKDMERKLDVSSWNMPTMFSVLSFSRGIVEFGDLFLMMMSGFLLIAVRLAAPFMIAVAIDRNLANKISYPFLWGVVVLTLIWPVVSYLIRSLAYLAGNMAMAMGDSQPLYVWDPATMQVISNPLAQPIYTIVIAAVIMLITGLCVWFSPVIAYKVSMGQVYESVSSTVSGWAAAIIGTGVELVSAQAAAALGNQAERTQAEGSYKGEVTRSTAGLEAGNLGVRARQIAAIAGARGGQVAALGQIYAARTQAVMGAQAGALFGVNSAAATTTLSKGDIDVRNAQAIGDLGVKRDQQSSVIEINRAADEQNWMGGKIIKGSGYVGDLLKGDGKSTARGYAGEGVKIAGGAYGLYQQYRSIQNRAEGQQDALNTATGGLINNQMNAAQGQSANQDVYFTQMTEAHQRYAQGQIDAANAGASQAAGGANRGTAITIGGINQGATLERRSNTITFQGSVQAAGQVRDAAFEVARLHALASVISAVGHNVARNLEHGLTLRY